MAKKKDIHEVKQFRFKIGKIELVEHKINVPSNFVVEKERLKYNFRANFNTKDASNDQIIITIDYEFLFDDEIIFSMQTRNEFLVISFEEIALLDKEKTNKFLTFLADLSIKHTRGIQSYLIKDEKISTLYIPNLDSGKLKVDYKIDHIKSVPA